MPLFFFTASLHRRFPINFLLLGAFTAVEAVSLGMVSMLYDVEAVLIAVGITTGIVLALTVFAFQVSDLQLIVFSNCDIRRFVITEKAPTRAFSWLKAATTAFTFKTLCPIRGLLRDYEPSDGTF